MPHQLNITPKDNLACLLDAIAPNPVKDLFFRDAETRLSRRQTNELQFQHYVVETEPGGQQEIHKLRNYSESELGRLATQPVFRFRWKCQRLLSKTEQILGYNAGSQEFEHQATLLWAEIKTLSEFLGSAPEVDELVAALHIAYCLHAQRLTPKPVIEALLSVFRLVTNYYKLPPRALDKALDALENAGVDLNYPLSFAKDA